MNIICYHFCNKDFYDELNIKEIIYPKHNLKKINNL